MKKLVSLLFAGLVGTMLFGQVSMDLNVIGRVDANPQFTFDGETPTFGWANSVVYTQLETSFGEHFALTLINHWATSGEELYPFGCTPDLYKNAFRTNESTFVDYLYLDYTINSWRFRVGKDVIAVGGFEYDDWDWDCTYDMCSNFWNENTAYQWGASVNWTAPSENTNFTLQAVSSPYSFNNHQIARPWAKGVGSYYFQHDGCYGNVETRNSIGFVDSSFPEMRQLNLALGARVNLLDESLVLGADFMDIYNIGIKENNFHVLGTCRYLPSDKFDVFAKIGVEYYGECSVFGGVTASYYPLSESQDLRLQATVAYTPWQTLGLTFGVTYNLPIHIL